MDDGRIVHAAPWPSSPPTRLQQRLLGLRWRRTNDRHRHQSRPGSGATAPPHRLAPLLLVPALMLHRAAPDRQSVDLGDADGRRPRDGHDDLHHGHRPDAGLRPDGRDELRPRRLHLASAPTPPLLVLLPAGRLAAKRTSLGRTWRRWACAIAGRDARDGASSAGLRARHHAAGLRPAPEADPDHDGRHDRRRAADPRALGRRPDPAAAARRPARRLPWSATSRSRSTA